jgi:hypothetical protein
MVDEVESVSKKLQEVTNPEDNEAKSEIVKRYVQS